MRPIEGGRVAVVCDQGVLFPKAIGKYLKMLAGRSPTTARLADEISQGQLIELDEIDSGISFLEMYIDRIRMSLTQAERFRDHQTARRHRRVLVVAQKLLVHLQYAQDLVRVYAPVSSFDEMDTLALTQV